ncbi:MULTISPECIES: division/cell wall cluster transcriptional repressor MraZ [unclassified Adlercreutzia]|uniref:division/cell wall cluster transcriptional repressor MraZ n=1 Tax=unclassified Adlercreutzia TaxID=2636013 RepID=UPI001F1555FF|nr:MULTISPECIES: division/cell wall cluster transcriptional repressor MraZ [unclassified Adlercreutzia]
MSENVEKEAASAVHTTTVRLNGEYRFKIDSKGRMSLPAKFRKVLTNELVVVREPEDECLYVFQPDDYENWIDELFKERFNGFNKTSRKQKVLMRKLKARARSVDIDSSGRIMLPADAREEVGIDGEVVVLGSTGYFEIWDPQAYDEMMNDEEISLSDFMTD